MRANKVKISDIKLKVKKCMNDKKAANSVIDILCYCQDDEDAVVLTAVQGLQKIFSHFFVNGDISAPDEPEQQDAAQCQLCKWLQEQYHTACDTVVEKLDSSDVKLREAALVAMMKFMEMEGKHPLSKPKPGHSSFPDKLLQEVVVRVLSQTEDQESVIVRLCELTDHDDVRYFLMKALKHSLHKTPVSGQQDGDRSEVYLANILSVIFNLQLPEGDNNTLDNFLSEDFASHPKVSSLKEHKILFTSCLMEFLRSELTPGIYRRVLTKLDEKVLPFLSSPLLLADFLTQSYNIGGAISLLALNGLFILIHKYNLDYPDFYQKFYTLFEPQIFQAKYCARFFHLADLFLSSTHLPSYLVAAFIKRISRLALTAPPPGAVLCIVFVENLIVRHPTCAILADRPQHTCQSDPFLSHLDDPAKTQALDSSLWEIQVLQSHYSPEVVQAALKVNHIIKQEQVITDYLDNTREEMLEKMVKKSAVNVVQHSTRPSCLLDGSLKRFRLA